MAKHLLSRLPGLRLLSVDLGHRYAAACAVWETLSRDKFEDECKNAKKEGAEVIVNGLYAMVRYPEIESNAVTKKAREGNRIKKFKPTMFFRRIGPDTLNSSSHPAPWARLDRQFTIKLQGEEKEARMATADEIWRVHCLEKDLGRRIPLIDRLIRAGWGTTNKQPFILDMLKKKGWTPVNVPDDKEDEEEIYLHRQSLSVDALMSSAVETVRLALRRHSDRARIAFGLTTEYKSMPGEQKYWFTEQKGDSYDKKRERHERHIDYLQDILLLWYDLAFGKKWTDIDAKEFWIKYINVDLEELEEELSGSQRKKKRESNKKKLKAFAEKLVTNRSLRMKLHIQWAEKWRKDDGNEAKTEDEIDVNGKKTGRTTVTESASGWYASLRWVNDWIFPRHEKKYKKNSKEVCNVGGLSLLRMDTIREFRRKVQISFFTRFRPDGTRGTIEEGFGQGTLDALEHMQDQRIKQLASRVVEAALGVGSEKRTHWHKGRRRPLKPIDDARFRPCHAVVIENLNQYRTKETRTKRENRMLAVWSQATFKKCLTDSCQLHGLHLREVTAGYTSKQDSRTGSPGVRCLDVPVKEFLHSPFWKSEVQRAEKAVTNNKDVDARSRYLIDLKRKFESYNNIDRTMVLRIPRQGGEIFVSADSGKCLQADLNAAANIGLKALFDPDWQGSWWYVPADLDKDGWRIPKVRSCNGAACLKLWKVAPKDKSFSKDGRPSVLGNDVSIKKAENECKEAKAAWVAAKKAVNVAKKGKFEPNIKKTDQQLEVAKEAYEVSKKKIIEAKKAAKAKPTINLWRDVSAHPLIEGEWLEYSDYWKKYVPEKVVGILRKQARLDKEDIPF